MTTLFGILYLNLGESWFILFTCEGELNCLNSKPSIRLWTDEDDAEVAKQKKSLNFWSFFFGYNFLLALNECLQYTKITWTDPK